FVAPHPPTPPPFPTRRSSDLHIVHRGVHTDHRTVLAYVDNSAFVEEQGRDATLVVGRQSRRRAMSRPLSRSAVSRRALLRGAGVAGAASVGIALSRPASAHQPAQPPLSSRQAFDQLDAALNDGNGQAHETNDSDSSGLGGKIAWGEAYALQAYALMYEAYRDEYYLDKMIDHIDQVLANRDSTR